MGCKCKSPHSAVGIGRSQDRNRKVLVASGHQPWPGSFGLALRSHYIFRSTCCSEQCDTVHHFKQSSLKFLNWVLESGSGTLISTSEGFESRFAAQDNCQDLHCLSRKSATLPKCPCRTSLNIAQAVKSLRVRQKDQAIIQVETKETPLVPSSFSVASACGLAKASFEKSELVQTPRAQSEDEACKWLGGMDLCDKCIAMKSSRRKAIPFSMQL
eukprot:1138926-Pelagomonas_calceolata.AAC.3